MPTLPLTFEVTFETNSLGMFNSEGADADGKGNIRHYSYLAKFPAPDSIPYRGAYAYEIDLSLGTNDCYLEELEGFDTAAAGTVALRMYFYATQLTMAASDRFTIATLQSAGPTDEATISVINNAGVIQLVAAETGATALGAATRACDLVQNQWHCLELVGTVDSGGGNDGVLQFFVDGYQIGANITGLDQNAITQGRFGAIGIDAGTTRGRLLFDQIAGDSARIGPLQERFGQTRVLTQSGHAVLGPAAILEADIVLSSANDETLQLFDSDTADTNDLSKRVFVYNAIRPIYVTRGLYCVLGGTNPVAAIKVGTSQDCSEAGIKALGLARQGV